MDAAYLGAGSAEWANFCRAGLALIRKKDDLFELKCGKRGRRLGWKAADQITPAYAKVIAHNRKSSAICWVESDAEAITQTPGEEVMKHVPADRPISRKRLVDVCNQNGLGKNRTNKLITELIDDKSLYVWSRKRKGAKPEVYVARRSRPDSWTDEMFTMITMPTFTRGDHLPDEMSDDHTNTPPYRGCGDDHHLHSDQEGFSLPVPKLAPL